MKACLSAPGAPQGLQSNRLDLRPPCADDLDDCARMWRDQTTTAFMGGEPFTREQVWSRLLRHVGHWSVLGFGFWTLRDRESGAFVGEAGFYHLLRELQPSPGDDPEVGWVLAPEARGKGLAREAVSTILKWADRHFSASKTICLIDPDNRASIGVALDCGFRPTGEVAHVTGKLVLLKRNRECRPEPDNDWRS